MEWLKTYLDLSIFSVLGLMSVIWLWMTLERWWFYQHVTVDDYTHIQALEMDLTKRLTVIASIGSNAPYVGLFGTVLGVMVAFNDIAQSGNIDTSSIMLGLALALKATAAGIALAIPAMISYNLLDRKAEVLLTQWQLSQQMQKGK